MDKIARYLRSLIFFFFLSASQGYAEKEIKILVLIIASDDQPVYPELQKIWRSYMHLDPEHVEAYFIKANPDLENLYEIHEDIVWSRTEECLSPGILHKTVLSMECFSSRLDEFDYILRPNLSSFYVFPQLLKFLKTLPRQGCYCGASGTNIWTPFASGCGFILSKDLVELLIKKKGQLFKKADYYDDVSIGMFLRRHGISLIPAPRVSFCNWEDWISQKDRIPEEAFHFRVNFYKPETRLSEELPILKELLRRYYHIVLED